jgi:hypothetical protein
MGEEEMKNKLTKIVKCPMCTTKCEQRNGDSNSHYLVPIDSVVNRRVNLSQKATQKMVDNIFKKAYTGIGWDIAVLKKNFIEALEKQYRAGVEFGQREMREWEMRYKGALEEIASGAVYVDSKKGKTPKTRALVALTVVAQKHPMESSEPKKKTEK